jgi:hypothetical protein
MSHLALRRVMIRLLHDPAFVAEVHADPARALAGVELGADERAWLVAQPRAAWRTDPARPARVLAALAEEFPASVELATEHAAGFLRSRHFHDAIQSRGSLALAFADHLASAPDPRVRAVVALERAVAEVRRAPPVGARFARPLSGARAVSDHAASVRVSSNVVIVRVPQGALAFLESLRTGARGNALGGGDEHVLATGAPDGEIGLEVLEPALAAVLVRARDGCTRDGFLAEACRQGAEPDEAVDLLTRLVADGLLMVGADDLDR